MAPRGSHTYSVPQPRVHVPLPAPAHRAGRGESAAAARSMERMGLGSELIVSSPFLRAKQTAVLVAARFDAKGSVKLSKTPATLAACCGWPRGASRCWSAS